MLSGVGGRTIAEAKERLSSAELNVWLLYRKRYGTFNMFHRLEHTAALISYCVMSTVPRKPGSRAPKYEDFLPQRNEPISLEEAMKRWK